MYTTETNCQILIALLKAHGIRRIIANPGTANMSFVGSAQQDPWFEVFSGVDERHSAYMAVGMASASGQPVVLSCTGATASRNYLPALTEAYYRKIPVLAITSTQEFVWQGQLHDQVIDRSQLSRDVALLSICCPLVKDSATAHFCERECNRAILELFRHGGGPVHINLETRYPLAFTAESLPQIKAIHRFDSRTNWPPLDNTSNIVVFIGEHKQFTNSEIQTIESFIRCHNAVVLINSQSGYSGYGAVSSELLAANKINGDRRKLNLHPDLIIHIGNITAAHMTVDYLTNLAPVWRISEDGEIRDLFMRCEAVFETSEQNFFEHYRSNETTANHYLEAWQQAESDLRSKFSFSDLPFSMYWIANALARKIPSRTRLQLGILSSVRAWNFTPSNPTIEIHCNSGAFGIEGAVSSAVGASIIFPEQLQFVLVGDLSFFYDLNAIGNRHIGKNLRILVVNNGEGVEFSLFSNPGSQFGDKASSYIGAGGHFGCQSRDLVRHFSCDLGFKYLSADDKLSFEKQLEEFTSPKQDRSIVFECFVDRESDKTAFKTLLTIDPFVDNSMRGIAAKVLPEPVKSVLRKIIP